MGIIKEEILNNAETLFNYMEKALKMKIVTKKEIEETDKYLKKEYPHMGYDLSKLYEKENDD